MLNCASKLVTCFALASVAWAGESILAFDRGLPQANLNNVSGAARSNVRWAADKDSFVGDDFAIGSPGEKWVVDAIRVWAIPGQSGVDPDHLGDFYRDVRLYFGADTAVTPRLSARLSAGSDQTDNPNVQISDATQSGTMLYDDFGKMMRVWQLDFTNLNLAVDGGAKYDFGVWGIGRAVPGRDQKEYLWFNAASNASFSSGRQDGADGVMAEFDGAGRVQGSLSPEGSVWDKGSDLNIQVFAHRVSGGAVSASTAAD